MENSWTAGLSISSRQKRKPNVSASDVIVQDDSEDDISVKPDDPVIGGDSWKSARQPDSIDEKIRVLIVGINPGEFTARAVYAYANRGNHFWSLQQLSEQVPFLGGLHADKTPRLPENTVLQYQIGLCNLVDRPSNSSADQSMSELVSCVPLLYAKIKRYKPNVILCNGKCIYEAIFRHAQKHPQTSSLSEPTLLHEVQDYIQTQPAPTQPRQQLATHIETVLDKSDRQIPLKLATLKQFQFGIQYINILPPSIQINTILLVTPCTSARVSGLQKRDKLTYFEYCKTIADIAKHLRKHDKWHVDQQ